MPGTRARSIEVELKFRLRDPKGGDRFVAADELGRFKAVSPVRTTQLEDRYLDTTDGALARAGFAARLRGSGGGTVVSVKSTARRSGSTGPHRREELEGPADRTSGPHDWPASDARSLILELCGDQPLVELVTIRQLRRRRELRDGATVAELSLDEVDVVARSRVVERFAELEVELIRGDEARLIALGETLEGDPALRQARGSKLESALAAVRTQRLAKGPLPDVRDFDDGLDRVGRAADADREHERERAGEDDVAEGDPPADTTARRTSRREGSAPRAAGDRRSRRRATDARGPARARRAGDQPSRPAETAPSAPSPPLAVGKHPGVIGDDHVAEAGRKVLRFHFARMLAREAGTRDGDDAEELHAMRVATRRMRAAWRVFGDGFRKGRTKQYRSQLRDVAGRLGAVRDLDVLLDAADGYREDLPRTEQRALEPLFASWRAVRDDARVLLLRELDSDGYRSFVEDFRVFVQTEGAAVLPVAPTQPHRIRDTAPTRIWRTYEQVRAYEPVLRWADVPTLHDLRIAGKWLRYTLEFVREPLGAGVEPLIARVVTLQDHLGLLHDADVAASMARTFLVERSGSLSSTESASIGRYLVSREREVARLHRTIGGPWRGVSGVTFRRGLGRVVAAL
jgi:CHAD domain-containing protein